MVSVSTRGGEDEIIRFVVSVEFVLSFLGFASYELSRVLDFDGASLPVLPS